MLDKSGVATENQVLSVFPEKKYLIKPKVVIECYEEIPCNPCETSCRFKAITIGENINTRPKLTPALCTGCGECVIKCPGLAILMVQVKDDKAIFKIPYELLPLPKIKEVWHGVNRSGEVICDVEVIAVNNHKRQNHTNVITVLVDKEYLYDFVSIRRKYE